ncbi:hypothetical protein [Sinomonas humi]|uniref:Uncharacterized protein n=1 Tax=Sinomonas humi TaxID=1338436 RepID=A0A0B2AQL7_9MICC|nr:hypothetical protein [Sinomonas humi]KHL04237.1 hypothetical protein LK10_06790 [Sinomonas humi]
MTGRIELRRPLSQERGGKYRYRQGAAQPSSPGDRGAEERIAQALSGHRQLLNQFRSRIRTLTAKRNEALVRALEDELAISAVANVIGETVPTVRRIALAFEEKPASGLSRDEHIDSLRKIRTELEAAAAAKEALEGEVGILIARAYQAGFTDETHLAGMAGISTESVHNRLRQHLGRPR